MIGTEERSFQDPYEYETLVDIEAEILKFVRTNGLEGMSLQDAERKRKQLERSSIAKPEVILDDGYICNLHGTLHSKSHAVKGTVIADNDWQKLHWKICSFKKANSPIAEQYKELEDMVTYEGMMKDTIQPIVSRNRKWNGSLPTYATKENLDSFHPAVMKTMSRQGDISRRDYWMSENWQTMPWCEKVTPKRQWNIICCDCNECTSEARPPCNHEFCNSIRKENDEILAVQKKIDKANLDIQLAPLIYQSDNPDSMYEGPTGPKRWQKHVLFTTKKVPDGHHVEWDSWKGTSFVKDKPVKTAKPADGPVSGFMINLMNENGMECPTWFRYGDAYEIVGLIYNREVANAKVVLEKRKTLHEHMKKHSEFPYYEECEECDATYLTFPESTDEWGEVTPALKTIVLENGDAPQQRSNPGLLCDPQTGHLAFNTRKIAVPWRTTNEATNFMTPEVVKNYEQGVLTYTRSRVAIVGTSNVPDWREKDFIPKVNEAIDWGIQKYGRTHLTIVSGGAKGVDSIVEQCCKKRGIDFVAIKPEVEQWKDSYGKRGYRTRNNMIAKTVCKLYNFVQASTAEQGPKCKHCPGELHWRSAGCWTEQAASQLGTEAIKVIVP
tara:strand:+ start:29 stop:1858 length:1830 start_codon:yes stop_codon:yes gene_type:complete